MKLTMEVNCTPDEAREFLGLPDIKPLQAKVLERVEQRLLEATSTFSPEGVLKVWFNAMPQAAEQYFETVRKLFDRQPTGS